MSALEELEKPDERYNPSAQQADSLFNAEKSTGQDAGVGAGIDQAEQYANDSKNASKNIDNLESNPDHVENQFFNPQGEKNQKKIDRARIISKKYGGIFGLISILGVGGGIIASFLGPASMVINLMENFTFANDSSSTAMEQRFFKVFNHMTKTTDPVCANSKKVKCKMGRISNKALNKLEKKGIKANFSDDTTNNGRRLGYPSKNPTSYTIDIDGKSSPQKVNAAQFAGFLADNPKIANKVLGRKGAFNLRVKAWSGKHISNKLYKKFGINRNGGIADGNNNKGSSASDKHTAAKEKLAGTIGEFDTDKATGDLKERTRKHLNKAKKGGVGYLSAVAGCVAVKAPGFIAAGVAGVQLAQIIPIYMDLVGSPGSKAKASGLGSGFDANDMNAIGVLLTQKTKRESDGKLTAATDSAIFQSALGVNKNKPALSKDLTPGYAVLTNPLVVKSVKAEKKSEAACNAVMSPAAMYTAMAADATVTVISSATIIGGVIKVAASWAISA